MSLTIEWNYPIDRMSKNTLCIGTAMLDGVPKLSGVNWSVSPAGAVVGVVSGGRFRITGAAPGGFTVKASLGEALSSGAVLGSVPPPVVVPPVVVTPPPPPLPVGASALGWKLHREDIQVWATNFYYNITPSMYPQIASRFDCLMGHPDIIPAELQLNPNLIFAPYTIQYTVVNSGHGIESGYMSDLLSWAAVRSLTPAQIDAMFLKNPDGTRLTVVIWGSERSVGDPRDVNWCAYQVNRYIRISEQANVKAIFIDEFGSGQVNPNFKKGANGDALALAAIIEAEVKLMTAIEEAVFPVQLIVNTASYLFQDDTDIAKAAQGVHMEQVNNPMNLDWWNSSWPFIDKLLAAGVLVNITSPFQFGEYEGVHDSKGATMDTTRGKLLELAAYYMMVTDPHLLAFHVENGDWSKYTIVQNWIGQIDAKLGHPIETRVRQNGTFTRRFQNGLVVVNPIIDRLPADYGTPVTITLPTDRKYGLLNADLTVGPAVTSISLRRPEAAIFKVVP